MNYEQAMDFIYSTSWMGSRLGLERMHELMRRLGAPQNRIPCIHIAGTNGKGSVAAMLASVYTRAGYKTGLYTSPAISYFGERMQIDHRPIPKASVCALTARMKQAAEGMDEPPTEYELITALAYLYFAEERAQIAIIETGLGGLLDATNVIDHPVACVITAIGLDHTKELGSTVEAITLQKAGIIKNGAPVILYEQDEAVTRVIREKAAEENSPLRIASAAGFTGLRFLPDGTDFTDEHGNAWHLGLAGTHQIRNAAVCLSALNTLNERFPLSKAEIRGGLSSARWPGRFERLQSAPAVIADGAHNPQAARALSENLRTCYPQRKIRFVVGVLSDKGYNSMVDELIPLASEWVTVTPDSDRALPASVLSAYLKERGQPVREAGGMRDALTLSLSEMASTEVLCVFGTLTFLHEVRSFFGKN